jgi:hypothetical protein
MALYRVDITVTLETYARTEDEAIRQVERAISFDTRIAAPRLGTSTFGGAKATIDPLRQ